MRSRNAIARISVSDRAAPSSSAVVSREQVLLRVLAACADEGAQVGVQVAGGLDGSLCGGPGEEDGIRPGPELLTVLGGDAEKLADDGDRQWKRELSQQINRPLGGHPGEEVFGDLGDPWLQGGDGSRGEGLRHQPP